jgi:hypothetical protein
VSPIRCEQIDLAPIVDLLNCPIKAFPIQYLGLPLSPIRLSKTDLQPLVDKLARHVLTWKSKLLECSGRLVLVNSTLTATPVYHMLSLDLPPWFFKCANKLIKGFFWSAAMEARSGQCIVAWDSVCTPKSLGGLGVKNLRLLNLALRIRWRWMEFGEDDKPWQGLSFRIQDEAEELFQTAVECRLGDGHRLKFWTDRWIGGCNVQQIAPNLLRLVKPARLTDCVADCLVQNRWAQAFRGTPSV